MSKTITDDIQLQEAVITTISQFKQFVKNIDAKKNSEIHNFLWGIRAELEFHCVYIKNLIDEEQEISTLQKKISKSVRGTAKRDKAIGKLSKFDKSSKWIEEQYQSDKNSIFAYLWKLKETIAVVLKAFPQKKFIWRNGDYVEESEEIFVI